MILIGITLLLFAFVGVPLFALLGGAALASFLSLPEGTWASPAIDMFGIAFAEQPSLITIPLFTFAGYLLAESGMPQRLIMLSRAWLGWVPGGLAVVCLIASAFFTSFTGGSGITIIAVGGLLFPAMIQEKYPEQFTLGLVTTGGSLGILFPPSVPLVMYGIITNLSMNKLLVAGIIPGTLVVIVLAIYGGIVGRRAGFTKTPFRLGPAFKHLWLMKWELAAPIVLMGGFVTGILRLHEAAVFTVVYVLFIEVVIYRDINIKRDLPRIVVESMTLVGAILIIMACAVGFTGWLIQAQVPMKLLSVMQAAISSQFLFLLVLNVFLVIVGMLMEVFAAIVVAVPLVLPLARAYGLDPYHFAIIFLLNLEIAYLAPPMGINLFISSIRFGRPVTQLYRSVLTFIGVLFVTLMVVSYVPILTTWLPSKVKGDEMTTMDMGPNDDSGGDLGVTSDDMDDSDFGLTGDELDKLTKDGGAPDASAASGEVANADASVAVDAGVPQRAAAPAKSDTGKQRRKMSKKRAQAARE